MSNQNNQDGNVKADIGSWVKVREHGEDEAETFVIAEETRPQENQVAPDNAMGSALVGAKPGDEITVDGPTGPIKFSVLDVGRDG
jgi:transcription elongation factor GreA